MIILSGFRFSTQSFLVSLNFIFSGLDPISLLTEICLLNMLSTVPILLPNIGNVRKGKEIILSFCLWRNYCIPSPTSWLSLGGNVRAGKALTGYNFHWWNFCYYSAVAWEYICKVICKIGYFQTYMNRNIARP